jgi:hypothetical protein
MEPLMTTKTAFEELKKRLDGLRIDRLFHGSESYHLSFTEEELLKDLTRIQGNDLLLGRFSEEQVRTALANYGVWEKLAEKGYENPKLTIRSIDPFRQTLKLFTSPEAPHDEDHLLGELRVFDAYLKGICPLTGQTFEVDALVIDWLNFQDPHASFTSERPPLPGQKYPGLGIMKIAMTAILNLARQSGKEAVINIPEYYHNAVLYRPAFRFFSAFVEGRFLALQNFLGDRSLAEASHLVTSQKIFNRTKGETFVWKPHEQVLGLVPRITEYFTSDLYSQKVQEAQSQSNFRFV